MSPDCKTSSAQSQAPRCSRFRRDTPSTTICRWRRTFTNFRLYVSQEKRPGGCFCLLWLIVSANSFLLLRAFTASPGLNMSIKVSTRLVDGVVIVDLFGQLRLGEGTSKLRQIVQELL